MESLCPQEDHKRSKPIWTHNSPASIVYRPKTQQSIWELSQLKHNFTYVNEFLWVIQTDMRFFVHMRPKLKLRVSVQWEECGHTKLCNSGNGEKI